MRSGEGKCTFNSLFEMPVKDGVKYKVDVEEPFNSLFEMPGGDA